MRPSNREPDQLRDISFTRNFTKHAEGSVLVAFGDTKVLCNVSIVPGVPRFLKDKKQGWLTAEYSMLPRATHERCNREAPRGKQTGRTIEIQRLIGRALRTALDLKMLGENTVTIDCDVLQADGGTRTAAITGSCVALYDALSLFKQKGIIKEIPLKHFISAVSVGVYKDTPVLDLDYDEDSAAQTDMNVIMNDKGEFIELQGTAEDTSFSFDELNAMLALAKSGAEEIQAKQKAALGIEKAINA